MVLRVLLIYIFILFNCSLVKSENHNKIFELHHEAELAFDSSNYSKVLELITKILTNNEYDINDSIRIDLLTIASHSADFLGRYDQCQEYNYQLLDLYSKTNDTLGIASALNDISIIHYYKSDYVLGLKYAKKSLDIHLNLNDTIGIAMCYNNMANCYSDDGDLQLGLEYYYKSLEFYYYLQDFEGQAICYANIGDSYQVLDSLETSKEYFVKGVEICKKEKLDDWYLLSQYLGLAKLSLKNNEPEISLEYCEKSISISENNDFSAELCTSYILTSEAYEALGNFRSSLQYYKLYTALNDTIYQDENNNLIEELNAKYELSEKEIQIEKKNIELESEKQKSAIEKWIIIIMIIFFIAIGLFLFFLFKESKKRKWANEKLSAAHVLIKQSFKEVRESIAYARKIQESILPKIDSIKKSFPNSFVLYKPKDVVSGDFYWFDKVNDISLLAVVDCTGHGVPGAFMSMMASNLLNQVMLDDNIQHPTEAFKMLDERLKYNLHQDDDTDSSNDGFDLSLIAFHEKESKIQFCGAKNNLYLISEGELIIKKASRSSIGGGVLNKNFTGEDFFVKKGDLIYMFTDGFADQFGGLKDKKFSYKRLRDVLLKNHKLPMEEQKEQLEIILKNWIGGNEQIDDICIVGIKF